MSTSIVPDMDKDVIFDAQVRNLRSSKALKDIAVPRLTSRSRDSPLSEGERLGHIGGSTVREGRSTVGHKGSAVGYDDLSKA